MTVVLFGSLVLWFCGGCPKDSPSTSEDLTQANPADQRSNHPDPFLFVALHLDKFEKMIQEHPKDCEATLLALLHFVDENKSSFLSEANQAQRDWPPNELLQQQSIQLLIEFSDRCPDQVARLNQAILAFSD